MWVNQNVGDYNQFKSLIKQRMLDQHLRTWKSKVDASSKCTFYRSIKISFELEKYLTSIPKILQQSVTRFRVSNHKLPVELFKHSGVPREKNVRSKSYVMKYSISIITASLNSREKNIWEIFLDSQWKYYLITRSLKQFSGWQSL